MHPLTSRGRWLQAQRLVQARSLSAGSNMYTSHYDRCSCRRPISHGYSFPRDEESLISAATRSTMRVTPTACSASRACRILHPAFVRGFRSRRLVDAYTAASTLVPRHRKFLGAVDTESFLPKVPSSLTGSARTFKTASSWRLHNGAEGMSKECANKPSVGALAIISSCHRQYSSSSATETVPEESFEDDGTNRASSEVPAAKGKTSKAKKSSRSKKERKKHVTATSDPARPCDIEGAGQVTKKVTSSRRGKAGDVGAGTVAGTPSSASIDVREEARAQGMVAAKTPKRRGGHQKAKNRSKEGVSSAGDSPRASTGLTAGADSAAREVPSNAPDLSRAGDPAEIGNNNASHTKKRRQRSRQQRPERSAPNAEMTHNMGRALDDIFSSSGSEDEDKAVEAAESEAFFELSMMGSGVQGEVDHAGDDAEQIGWGSMAVRAEVLDSLAKGMPDRQLESTANRLRKFASSTGSSDTGVLLRAMEGQLSKLPHMAEWAVPLIRDHLQNEHKPSQRTHAGLLSHVREANAGAIHLEDVAELLLRCHARASGEDTEVDESRQASPRTFEEALALAEKATELPVLLHEAFIEELREFEEAPSRRRLLPLVQILRRKLRRHAYTILPNLVDLWGLNLPEELAKELEIQEGKQNAARADLAEWLKQGRRKCYFQTVRICSPWSLEELCSLEAESSSGDPRGSGSSEPDPDGNVTVRGDSSTVKSGEGAPTDPIKEASIVAVNLLSMALPPAVPQPPKLAVPHGLLDMYVIPLPLSVPTASTAPTAPTTASPWPPSSPPYESSPADNPDAGGTVEAGAVLELEGSVESPEGSVESPEGSVESPEGSVESPEGSVESPEGSVESPEGSVESPEDFEVPSGEGAESRKEWGEADRGGSGGQVMGSEEGEDGRLSRHKELLGVMDWVRKQKWRSTLSTALNSDELQQMALQHDREADRTVFIDDIPDEVDEDEVAKAFWRCGDVEKVSLYRPLHLDESKKEYQSGKKRKDFRYMPKGYSSAACSTNHGFVTFTSREGYAKASHETMRIFGVQLRDSMCRTRPTERCTALFVENREGVTGEDMEASVNRALDPNFRVLLKKDDHMTTVPQVLAYLEVEFFVSSMRG